MVESVTDQTDQASALAGIQGQRLLTDPRTNPATRPHADRLRNDQQRAALDLQHRRQLRRGRVDDRRAAHAESALNAITAARETASPALSVVALHTGRRRYMGVALAASLALSVGAALGVEALAQAFGAPTGVGYLAEIGLTGLSTSVILYRSHLAQHTHRTVRTPELWHTWVLWVLMLVPLAGSVIASTAGSGPVGALCSVGAAAFAVLAYLVADRSSAVMRDTAELVDRADEDALRAEAMGADLFTPVEAIPDEVVAPEATPTDDSAEVDPGEQAVAQIEDWLAQRSPVRDVLPRLNDAATAAQNGTNHTVTATRHFEPDQGNGRNGHGVAPRNGGPVADVAEDGGESTEQVVDAVHANRVRGAHTRYRVAEHLAVHPDHTPRQIAQALGIGESTARRHKRDVEADDGGEP